MELMGARLEAGGEVTIERALVDGNKGWKQLLLTGKLS